MGISWKNSQRQFQTFILQKTPNFKFFAQEYQAKYYSSDV